MAVTKNLSVTIKQEVIASSIPTKGIASIFNAKKEYTFQSNAQNTDNTIAASSKTKKNKEASVKKRAMQQSSRDTWDRLTSTNSARRQTASVD